MLDTLLSRKLYRDIAVQQRELCDLTSTMNRVTRYGINIANDEVQRYWDLQVGFETVDIEQYVVCKLSELFIGTYRPS